MADLVLVRHGETAGQSSEYLYGRTDIELGELGILQMRMVAKALSKQKFDLVITSPMIRSKQGADLIMEGRDVKRKIVEDFIEINFGDWEGMSVFDLAEKDPENYQKWMEGDSSFTFPGGDNKKEFFDRVSKAALNEFGQTNLKILAVLHKGVIKGVISALTGVSVDNMTTYPIELGSIHHLQKLEEVWEFIEANKVEHLGTSRMPISR